MRRTGVREKIKAYFELIKFRIALFSSFTALAGSVIAAGGVTLTALAAAACLFVLAGGACALNEYQERKSDARMERTMGRPIPSKRIQPQAALLISALLIASGILLLAISAGPLSALFGGLAALWYNGVYTPLKKRSPFSAVPGAVSGVLPPCVGWVAVGGSLTDPRLSAAALLFFLWQVPHFWLLLLSYGVDPEHYARAGIASPVGLLGRERLRRVTSVWLCATAVSGTVMPLFGLVRSLWALAALIASATALFLLALCFPILEGRGLSARRTLRGLHAFTLLTVVTAAADSLIRR